HSTGIDISRYHFAISVFGQVVALVAVDAQRRAVFQQCSNRQGIAIGRQGDAIAEAIVSNDQVFIFVGLFGIGSFDVSLLRPDTVGLRNPLHGTWRWTGVTGLISINAGGIAVFCRCGYDKRLPIGRDIKAPAEPVTGIGIGSFDIANRAEHGTGGVCGIG